MIDKITARSLTSLGVYSRPQPEHKSTMPLSSNSSNSFLRHETSYECGLLHTIYLRALFKYWSSIYMRL